MGWGNSDNERPPPRAFSGSNLHHCNTAIKKMAEEQRFLITQDLKVPELCQLLVPQEHREPLTEAFRLSQLTYPSQELFVRLPKPPEYDLANGGPAVTFAWNHDSAPDGFFVPKNTDLIRIQPDAPEDLREKYLTMFDRLVRVSYEWGMVQHVFNCLNQNGYCNTPQQMRYVWPAIRHIADRFSPQLGNSLVDASARAGDKARVPPGIKDLMVPTVNIVARSTLLDRVNMNVARPFSMMMANAEYFVGDSKFPAMV